MTIFRTDNSREMEDDAETLLCLICYLEDVNSWCPHVNIVIECLIIPLSRASGFETEGGLPEFLLQYFVFLREGNREGVTSSATLTQPNFAMRNLQ